MAKNKKKSKNKKIKSPASATGKRFKSTSAGEVDYDAQTPIFSLEHMQDGFCLNTCEPDAKAAFADAIFKRSKLTWRKLKQLPRHGLGFETIKNGIKAATPQSITEEVTFIAFRFWGMKPMVGYRDRRVFHIVWLDLKLDLYKH